MTALVGHHPSIVCGRKFCADCGRWRLVSDFGARREGRGSIYLESRCYPCRRAMHRRIYRPRYMPPPPRVRPTPIERVDSAKFVAWLDRWTARQAMIRDTHEGDRHVLSEKDLAREAGTSGRAFSRARVEGLVSIRIVDAVLIAAHSDIHLDDLVGAVDDDLVAPCH